MSSQIVPAILTDDLKDFTQKIRQIEAWAPSVHIDVSDGDYVPSTTVTFARMLAVSTTLSREFHLMVRDWERTLRGCSLAPSDRVVIPSESLTDSAVVTELVQRFGPQLVIGVRPGQPVPQSVPTVPILILGVEPGFQGGEFIPETIDRLRQCKHDAPDRELILDGGVTPVRIRELHAQKIAVDRYVVGSALWNAADPEEMYRELVQLTT